MPRKVNPDAGYLGNNLVKKDGVKENFTREEVDEYVKCMNDPMYFAEKYIKLISLDDGLISFKPYEYQRRMFKHFEDNRFSIVLACRQSGKSISTVIYILWYAIFNPEKTIAILANKGATAREMLARITLALENLPFFLQPGCKSLNKGNITFGNNTKIIASATTGSSIRGLSVNLLYLDEFAFVENAAEFYTSTYPVVSAGKDTKVIITSTANGVGNIYHRLYEGASQGTNGFKSFRVDWWDVPGRDEEWKTMTIANTSELQFEQEFGNNFHGTSNTLVSTNTLLEMKSVPPIDTRNDVYYYEKVEEDGRYIMTVDVSKGRGQDYSSFSVIRIHDNYFEQVCTYRNNLISPMLFPDIIVKVASYYNDAIVVIESNDVGQVVCNYVYYEYEYENMFVSSAIKASGLGVLMTKRVKRIGCSNLKDILEMNKLIIRDAYTIDELSTFEVSGNSYAASAGNHDDMVMNLVMFSWFVSSDAFGDINDMDLKELLYQDRAQELEEDVPLFGVIEDGSTMVGTEFDKMKRDIEKWNDL
jgi:hypothetical protein